MIIYGKEHKLLKTEELEQRLDFLKRNPKLWDSLGDVKISYKRRQERLIIEEELRTRKGA